MFRVFITRQWPLEPALLDGSAEARNWVESIAGYRSFQDPLNVIDDHIYIYVCVCTSVSRSMIENNSTPCHCNVHDWPSMLNLPDSTRDRRVISLNLLISIEDHGVHKRRSVIPMDSD